MGKRGLSVEKITMQSMVMMRVLRVFLVVMEVELWQLSVMIVAVRMAQSLYNARTAASVPEVERN